MAVTGAGVAQRTAAVARGGCSRAAVAVAPAAVEREAGAAVAVTAEAAAAVVAMMAVRVGRPAAGVARRGNLETVRANAAGGAGRHAACVAVAPRAA